MSNELQREWNLWSGAKKPPYTGTVEVKYCDGNTGHGESGMFRWSHTGSRGDIVAWRPAWPLAGDDFEKVETALDTQIGGEHYKNYAVQPVEFITKNKLGFLEGCVIKRICRYEDKNGLEDLKKAKHEIDLLIELKYGRQA